MTKRTGNACRILVLFIGLCFLVQGGVAESRCIDPNNAVYAYFNAINTADPELKEAMRQFPKGADIHNHMWGTITPETYIDVGKKDGNCYGVDPVDPTMFAIVSNTGMPGSCPSGSSPLSGISDADRQRLVRSLSMHEYPYADIQSGHDQFFATFGRLGLASDSSDTGIMLTKLLQRAGADSVSYVETMMFFQSNAISDLADKLRQKYSDTSCYTDAGYYEEMLDFLTASGLHEVVAAARRDIAAYMNAAGDILKCGASGQDNACLVSYALLAAVDRNSSIKGSPDTPDLPRIFTQTAFSFMLSLAEKNVVGVNLLGQEDSPVSMQSFRTVMQFFSFFHCRPAFSGVNIALHAGEIIPCFVGKGNPALKDHLTGSINAGAKRIGHAVSIAYLDNPDDQKEVVDLIKAKNSLVEMLFTSNAQILGVAGSDHAFTRYWHDNVPTAFSTDDEGISYATYTDEWIYAYRQYGSLNYDDLVRLARYSLQYSFAPGAPLWQDVPSAKIVDECKNILPGSPAPPEPCKSFLAGSGKAKLQWDYETSLSAYIKRFGWRLKGYKR